MARLERRFGFQLRPRLPYSFELTLHVVHDLEKALMMEEKETGDHPDSVELPIEGVLDLHTFRPSEVKELLPAYFEECRRRGILEVRVIHGKGTGALRETVHALLRRMSEVASFSLAGREAGGWGATLVVLRPL